MITELLLTLILLCVNFFTSIGLPFGLPLLSEGISGSLDSFLGFFPEFPLIPYKALAVSFTIVLSVFLLTILYKIVRIALSLILK